MSKKRGYSPLFVPDAKRQPFSAARAFRLGDTAQSEGVRYVFDDATALAVNVALATGRPLLLRGHPGTGKTSLASSVARQLRWRYYAMTISSRSTGRDLLWTFDAVARLADAEAKSDEGLRHERAYITPGPLWWAFDRDSARWRGVPRVLRNPADAGVDPVEDPSEGSPDRAVVLIDEIDKADPDVPNDLLQALGGLSFRYDDRTLVEAQNPPLVVVTTNEERDLPRAFVRRCVVHTLEQPTPERLREIATTHEGEDFDETLYEQVYDAYATIRTERIDRHEPPPSLAELLDALAACRVLRTGVDAGQSWTDLARNLLDKATKIPPEKP